MPDKNNSKMKKIFLISLIALFLLPIVYSKTSPFNPRIDDWYKVEDWEVEVCQKWGGTAKAQHSVGATITQEQVVSQLTVTLQAQKTKYPDNTTLYEVAYYVQPFNSNVDFAVRLKYSNEAKKNQTNIKNDSMKITGKTSVEKGSFKADYKAFISAEKFDLAQIRFKSGDSDKILTVPIMDAAEGYSQTSSTTGSSEIGTSGTSEGDDWSGW